MQGKNLETRGRGRPKKGREHDAEQLFAAAVACFAELGFEKSSLRMIADRAGVDVALISYRYGSKLGLWTAVVDAVAEDTLHQLADCREASLDCPPEEKIHRMCVDLVEVINRRPLFSQLFISEIMTSTDNERKKIIEEKIARPVHDVLLDYLSDVRSPKLQRPADPSLEIVAATSVISTMISTRSFLMRFVDAAEDNQRLTQDLASIAQRILS